MPSCSASECDRQISCRSLCTLHYQRWRKNGSTELKNKPAVHGHVSKYKAGCRCEPCKAAKREEDRLYRKANSQSVAEAKSKWFQSNPDKRRHYQKMYKQRKRNSQGSYSLDEWVGLKEQFGDRCVLCGVHESAVGGLHADHIVPVSLGGVNSIENIQPLCPRDNLSKGNRNSIDYRVSEGLKGRQTE